MLGVGIVEKRKGKCRAKYRGALCDNMAYFARDASKIAVRARSLVS